MLAQGVGRGGHRCGKTLEQEGSRSEEQCFGLFLQFHPSDFLYLHQVVQGVRMWTREGRTRVCSPRVTSQLGPHCWMPWPSEHKSLLGVSGYSIVITVTIAVGGGPCQGEVMSYLLRLKYPRTPRRRTLRKLPRDMRMMAKSDPSGSRISWERES